jgi:acetyltransferase-like isoleucine patch superfamily enzyme
MNSDIKDKILDTIVDMLRTPIIQHRYGEYPHVYFVTRPKCKVYVGSGSYSNKFYPIKISSQKNQTLTIGKYTSIGDSLNLIMSGGHNYELLTTYPFRYLFRKNMKTFSSGNINIGNDVWIGSDVTIVGGNKNIKIGDGVVIGSKSLITSKQKLDDYGIYAGIPVKLIKYRFDRITIKKLKKLKWWDLPKQFLINNLELFYEKDPDKVIKELNKEINKGINK